MQNILQYSPTISISSQIQYINYVKSMQEEEGDVSIHEFAYEVNRFQH